MKRKKEILLFLVMIPMLFFSFTRLGGYYLTAEEVLYATERGMGCSPSKGLAEDYVNGDGERVLVGVGADFFTTVTVKPAFGVFLKPMVGSCIDVQRDIEGFVFSDGKILGLSKIPQVVEVYSILERLPYEETTEVFYEEKRFSVEENGYFSGQAEKGSEKEVTIFFSYIEGRDENGTVLYQWGRDAAGNLFYE